MQLCLALLGGYLLGVTSERAFGRELTGNLVLRWFVGLELVQRPWDHSTFSQNRKRRFTESGLLERLFDETVALAIEQKLVSPHTPLEGTLGQAHASHKSCVPMDVFLKPEEYKRRMRSLDQGADQEQEPGNPTVTLRGERRANQTPVSTTDPDAKLANKGSGTAARVGYPMNGVMENRHRLLVGITVASFRGPASEMDGGRALLDRFHLTHALRIQTVGADKGYVAKPFLTALVRRRLTPHIAAKTTGREAIPQRVRRLSGTVGYRLSQRARKTLEELWGEAQGWHGFRRFQRRGPAAGSRRSVSDGLVAQSQATGEIAPGPGVAVAHRATGAGREWESAGDGRLTFHDGQTNRPPEACLSTAVTVIPFQKPSLSTGC